MKTKQLIKNFLGSNKILKICILFLILGNCHLNAQTTVSSLQTLLPYLDDDNANVKLSPGTYTIDSSNIADFGNPILLFAGNNSTYDFTGVTINYNTEILSLLGNVIVYELAITGNDNTLNNLKMIDVGDQRPRKSAIDILMDGQDNKIEGFDMTVKGSYPYGYGDAFGKGSGFAIKHYKHAAIQFRGTRNHLKDCTIDHKAYGHAIFMQGAVDALIEGCVIEGEMRTTDDMLLEQGTGSPADLQNFMTVWGYSLPAGYTMSLQEDGIRNYAQGTTVINGVSITRRTENVTVKNCTVKNMRDGISLALGDGTKYAEGCSAIGCEKGFLVTSGTQLVNCSADAVYGPVYHNQYGKGGLAAIDLEILPGSTSYSNGSKAIAYMGGSNNNIKFTSNETNIDPNLKIIVGGAMDDIRYKNGNLNYQHNFTVSGTTLENLTNFPVYIPSISNNNTIITCAPVDNNGSGNTIDCGSTPTPTGSPSVTLSALENTDGSVTLNWTNQNITPTNQSVFRNTVSSMSGRKSIKSSVTGTSFTDTSGTAGVTYWYWIKATDASGNTNSNAATPIVNTTPSVNLTASAGSGSVTLNWTNQNITATKQSVFRNTVSSASGRQLIGNNLTGTSYTDTSGTVGTKYWYWVKVSHDSTNTNSNSANATSTAGSTPTPTPTPTAPSVTLSALENTDGSVTLNWTNQNITPTNQTVFRNTVSSMSGRQSIKSSVTGTSFTDTSGTAGTTYWYWIKASDASGNTNSNAATPIVNTTPSVNLTASAGSGSVTLNWINQNLTATQQSVFRNTVSSASGRQLIGNNLTGTSYTDTSGTVGTKYWYWVKVSHDSTNTNSNSANATSTAGSTPTPTPTPTPTASSVTLSALENTDGSVTLNWTNQNITPTNQSVFRNTVSSMSGRQSIKSSVTGTSFTDASGTAGTTYWYWIKASDASGNTNSNAATPIVNTTPSVNLTASAGSGSVTLNWTNQNITPTNQSVFRNTVSSMSGRKSIKSSVTGTSFTDTSGTSGVTYWYWIKATDASGNTNSNAASATPSSSAKIGFEKTVSDTEELLRGTEKVIMYPNPVSNKLTISFANTNFNTENTHIEIFTINGKKVMETFPKKISEVKVNLSKFSKGIYIIKVNDGTETIIKKVVKL